MLSGSPALRRRPKVNLPANDILIDNVVYTVEVHDADAMGPNVGLKCGVSKRIVLSDGQTDADFLDTFWHEVIHALLSARCRDAMGEDVEEVVVRAATAGFIQVLRDNPDWVAWALDLGVTSGKRRSMPQPAGTTRTLPNLEKENPDARTDDPPCDAGPPTGVARRFTLHPRG